jgi:hypothetical protein
MNRDQYGHANGPAMVIGHTYFQPGLDMDCFPVAVRCTLVELRPRKELVGYDGTIHWQDCVTNADGINVITDSRTLYTSAAEALAGHHNQHGEEA